MIDLYKRSLLIARTQIGRNGAIMASTDTDIVHYNRDTTPIWPRDGAFVAYAFDEAGYSEVTRTFFRFCSDLLSPGGFLWHKYNPDGSVGSSWHPWMHDGETHLPIQEDETAVVLFALEKHYLAVNDLEFVERLYTPLIKPAADFLAGYRDSRTGLPLDSYDLWEERRGIFTYTVCTVWAGLRAATRGSPSSSGIAKHPIGIAGLPTKSGKRCSNICTVRSTGVFSAVFTWTIKARLSPTRRLKAV